MLAKEHFLNNTGLRAVHLLVSSTGGLRKIFMKLTMC